MFLIKEALTLFYLRKLRGAITMYQIVEDFKISLVEDGKSPKTDESYARVILRL